MATPEFSFELLQMDSIIADPKTKVKMIADPKSMGWFTGKFTGFSLYFMGKSTSTNPDPQSGQQFSGAKRVPPWLCLQGLYLQSVDWDGPLCEVAQEARASPEALLGHGSHGNLESREIW
jgi:hypothetical protein